MLPPAVVLQPAASAEQTYVHTCLVCGDHRVAVWRLSVGREEHVNVHANGSGADLRQVGRVLSFANGQSVVEWTHYVDDIEVTAHYWETRLADRRRLARARVSN